MVGSHRAPSLALALALLASAAPASAARSLGVNVHQSTGVGLDVARDAGLRFVRIDLNWFDVEPKQGSFDWSRLDAVVDGAKARGLEVLAVLSYAPAWASSGDTKGDGTNNDVPKPGTYEAFVAAAVDHFKDRVAHYELWNEPNLGDFFEGTKDDYAERLLVPGAKAVHAACPSCKVVAPGIATIGGEWDAWLDRALTAAKDDIDIVSGHDYGKFPVDDPGAGTTSDSFFNRLDAHRTVYVGETLVYEGPLSPREVMLAHGVNKPYWLTETGKEAHLGSAAEEAKQAAYTRHVLEAMLTRPWWEATFFYEAFDTADQKYTFGFALEDSSASGGYQPKAAMGVVAKAAASQPAFGGNGTDCDDGLDNEGDGKVDAPDDPDCSSKSGTSEGMPPSQGGAGGGGQGGSPGAAGSGGVVGAGGSTPVGSAGAEAPTNTAESGGGCALESTPASPRGALFVLGAVVAGALARRARRYFPTS